MRLGKVIAVDPDIHQHAGRAGQTLRRVAHVPRRALDHPNQLGQGHGRYQRIVVGHHAVRETELPHARINRYQLVI